MSKVTDLVALDLESQHWGGVSSVEQSSIKTGEGGTNLMISDCGKSIQYNPVDIS